MKREDIEYFASLPPSQKKMALDILDFIHEKEKEQRKADRVYHRKSEN